MRNIKQILLFREDISPFLVHLTRDEGISATCEEALTNIISEKALRALSYKVSDARFGMNTLPMTDDNKKKYFGAICFTETPINEIHCLLDIGGRTVHLRPYGLVFIKENLQKKGISPVFYINNENEDKNEVIQTLCSLIDSNSSVAAEILPLVAVFGRKIRPLGAEEFASEEYDFRWEREWRYPFSRGALNFSHEDVFIGLCPHDKISDFEAKFENVEFIDPMRNMKYYADKLIRARHRLDLKFSVV